MRLKKALTSLTVALAVSALEPPVLVVRGS